MTSFTTADSTEGVADAFAYLDSFSQVMIKKTNPVVKDEAIWGLPDFPNPLPMDRWAEALFTESNIAEIRDNPTRDPAC